MDAPKFYYMPESGPSRTVMIAAKVLGINLEFVHVDLFKGEHLKPEFLKINPLHKVPVLVDDDLIITESRVIITYLAEKYAQDDSLYPADLKKRAQINQRLYFDIGTLYEPILNCYAVIYWGSKEYDESHMPKIHKGFELLNTFLENSKFAVGETLTVADIALISTVATAVAVLDFDLKQYPNVEQWFETVKAIIPDYKETVEDNATKLKNAVDFYKAKNNES